MFRDQRGTIPWRPGLHPRPAGAERAILTSSLGECQARKHSSPAESQTCSHFACRESRRLRFRARAKRTAMRAERQSDGRTHITESQKDTTFSLSCWPTSADRNLAGTNAEALQEKARVQTAELMSQDIPPAAGT